MVDYVAYGEEALRFVLNGDCEHPTSMPGLHLLYWVAEFSLQNSKQLQDMYDNGVNTEHGFFSVLQMVLSKGRFNIGRLVAVLALA